jgi:hypothetical protein
MGIRQWGKDFRNGVSFIFSKPEQGQGDRKLAKMCALVEAQIPAYGKHAVRTQMIKSIDSDLRRAAKKGGKEAVDALIAKSLATPEYVSLLHKVGLEEAHIRVAAIGALKNEK